MKKQILFSVVFLSFLGTAQFIPSNTSTTDNKYRSGSIALGYDFFNPPTFGTNKLMVNGNSYFSSNIGLGTLTPSERLQLSSGNIKLDNGKLLIGSPFSLWAETIIDYSIKTDRGIAVLAQQNAPTTIAIYPDGSEHLIQMAIASCQGCFSQNAELNDPVLRGNSSGSFIITNEKAGKIKFATKETTSSNSLVRMTIDNTGKIGIGTETPDSKLAVNGLIHAKEVKVDLQGWPDYVFEKNYKLKTLEEVEKHITEKGYLPEMPSAKEVEQNGIELGEMNKKLVEKIEELTLYVIELKKELEEVKSKLNE